LAVKATVVLSAVFVVRALLGVWVAAGLVAMAAVAGLIAGLAALEARVFDRQRATTSTVVRARGLGAGDHVAFARALSAVAAAYLTECERQDRLR
jgi:hypothetical protein